MLDHFIRVYTSIETCRLLPDQTVEWVMATASDAKGYSCFLCSRSPVQTWSWVANMSSGSSHLSESSPKSTYTWLDQRLTSVLYRLVTTVDAEDWRSLSCVCRIQTFLLCSSKVSMGVRHLLGTSVISVFLILLLDSYLTTRCLEGRYWPWTSV